MLRYPKAFFTPITFRNDRMPHSASAKKRLRQNVRSRDRNKAMKSEMKTSIRKVLEALSAKDVTAAKDLFKSVAKKADQAATAKTIHRNKAARIKSRLSARIVKTAQSAAS
ncbi:MAG TPA: 30S ribosomal protein S20 [Planctomycetaceae bacterium]|nr:30S ribosomal protein S20 [Planctomycetaceae bacterium]HBP83160.1 30S ribosomal protein S20 [Planctomycetaceae bacterium]